MSGSIFAMSGFAQTEAGVDFCVSGIVVLPTVSWMAYLLVTKAIEALLIGIELSGDPNGIRMSGRSIPQLR